MVMEGLYRYLNNEHNKAFKRDSQLYYKTLFYKFFFLDATPGGEH